MHSLSGQTIVFLPGMDGTGISFEPLGRALPQDVRVKVVTYPTDIFLSFEETLKCVIDQLQSYQEDVIVIAESFSGPVAVALIASGQLKAKCLVLCATFARSPRPVLLQLLRCLPLELLMRLPFPRFIFKRLVEGADESADMFLAMWQRVKTMVPAKILIHRLKIIRQVDVRKLLPKLTLPCLYIQASSDRSVPASALQDFMELVPDLKVQRIKGPHFILQAQPEEALKAIQDFATRIS